MQEEKKVAWSTQDEIKYINHIKRMATGEPDLKLITGYIAGIEQRTEWALWTKKKLRPTPMLHSISSKRHRRDLSSMAGVFLLTAVVALVLGVHAVAVGLWPIPR